MANRRITENENRPVDRGSRRGPKKTRKPMGSYSPRTRETRRPAGWPSATPPDREYGRLPPGEDDYSLRGLHHSRAIVLVSQPYSSCGLEAETLAEHGIRLELRPECETGWPRWTSLGEYTELGAHTGGGALRGR